MPYLALPSAEVKAFVPGLNFRLDESAVCSIGFQIFTAFSALRPGKGMEATVKLLFDETIARRLDIESILFLSERIQQLLCDEISEK